MKSLGAYEFYEFMEYEIGIFCSTMDDVVLVVSDN